MKNRFLRILVYWLIGMFPSLRFNWLKINLLNLCGHKISKGVVIASTVKFLGNFCVHIGENTFIGHETIMMGGSSDIFIGNNCDISSKVCFVMGSHKIDPFGKRIAGEGTSGSIRIDDGAWIGANSTILSGVTIGKKAIIGAGSIVNKDIPPYNIAVGNPCKPIKRWNEEIGLFESII